MPRQTFFNLPEEKQRILKQAAKKEFSRVPLFDASIANIVKEAEIPRGSFYQYFDDKDDLYFYLLHEHTKEKRLEFIDHLKKHHGNIFPALSDMFRKMLREMESEGTRNFYRNVFLNMNYETERAFLQNMSLSELHTEYSILKKMINWTDLNVTGDRELVHIIKIVGMIMMQNLVQKFAKEMTNEEVMDNYEAQLHLLKKGFVKG